MSPEEIVSRILYRDASVLVLDKPQGLPVHPGPGGGVTLTDLLPALRFGLPNTPELAHRLDRDTSGCLVLGRHRRAIARLNALFRAGEIEKTYWALVQGGPTEDSGLIELPMARRSPERGWWMKVDAAGVPAATRFRVLARGEAMTLLELAPLTGRTHQLRVHCAASGYAILGDAIYGDAPRFGGPALHLHARRVVIPFDPRRAPLDVAAAPHEAFLATLHQLGLTMDNPVKDASV